MTDIEAAKQDAEAIAEDLNERYASYKRNFEEKYPLLNLDIYAGISSWMDKKGEPSKISCWITIKS